MNTVAHGERQPLLSSEVFPTISENQETTTVNQPVSMQVENQETSVHDDNPEESNNASTSPTSEEKPNTQVMAAEGFLAICGSCRGKVLFPLGFTRVNCVHCGALNYMSPQAIPMVARKALLICPNCKVSILYTIGCTHFQCTCGSVIEIPIPDYYVPHFSKPSSA